jgi:hypothetical protein
VTTIVSGRSTSPWTLKTTGFCGDGVAEIDGGLETRRVDANPRLLAREHEGLLEELVVVGRDDEREVQLSERTQRRRRLLPVLHACPDLLHQRMTRTLHLVEEGNALQIPRILIRQHRAETRTEAACELLAQRRAERGPLLRRVDKGGALRRRRVHSRSQEKDALSFADNAADLLDDAADVSVGSHAPFLHWQNGRVETRQADSEAGTNLRSHLQTKISCMQGSSECTDGRIPRSRDGDRSYSLKR